MAESRGLFGAFELGLGSLDGDWDDVLPLGPIVKPPAFLLFTFSLLDSGDRDVGRVEACSPVDGCDIERLVEEASPGAEGAILGGDI